MKEYIGAVCVIRISNSGVHVGTVVRVTRQSVTIADYTRLWSWKGALCVDSIAESGVESARFVRGKLKTIDRQEGGEIVLATSACVDSLAGLR